MTLKDDDSKKNNDTNQRNMSRLNLTLPKNINLISYFEKNIYRIDSSLQILNK